VSLWYLACLLYSASTAIQNYNSTLIDRYLMARRSVGVLRLTLRRGRHNKHQLQAVHFFQLLQSVATGGTARGAVVTGFWPGFARLPD
jgi:hypothetical protein